MSEGRNSQCVSKKFSYEESKYEDIPAVTADAVNMKKYKTQKATSVCSTSVGWCHGDGVGGHGSCEGTDAQEKARGTLTQLISGKVSIPRSDIVIRHDDAIPQSEAFS